jgi:hypothetical protein
VATFKEALQRQDGAAMRVAIRITAEEKKQLAEQMLSPSAMFLGGIYDKLRAAQSISLGIWPEENTRLDASLVFETADDAAGFKQAVDKLLMGFSQLMTMASAMGSPEDKAKAEKQQEAFRAALAPFLMTQDGSTLKTSINVEQIKRIQRLSEEAKPPVTQPAAIQSAPGG